MMKPYPQKGLITEKRVFNYRLSRMRRISENVFGILANCWRAFRRSFSLEPEKVKMLHLLLLHFIIGYERTLVMERFTFLVS